MAEEYVGARKEIAFTKETTRGTAVDPSAGDWQPHDGIGFGPMVDKAKDMPALGRIEDTLNSAIIRAMSQGPINLRVTKDFIGHIFCMLAGQAPTTTGPVTSIYTHDWAVFNSNEHRAYTVTVKDPIRGFKKYANGMLEEANFEFSVDKIPTVVLNYMAGQEAASSATSTAYSTTYEYPFFVPQNINLYFADTVASVFSATPRPVNAINVLGKKNLLVRKDLGNVGVTDINNQRMGFGGSLGEEMTDTVFFDYALSNTKKVMGIKLDDGAGTIVKFTFPRVGFEEVKESDGNDQIIGDTVTWFSEYDTTNGMVLFHLENLVSSYA